MTISGFANIDYFRAERTGAPEAVFCAGKTPGQAEAIILDMRERGIPVLATRVNEELADRLRARFPEAVYDKTGKILTIGEHKKEKSGRILILTAGTSDLPAAAEAARTAEFLGSKTVLIADVGVAGLHRLLARLEDLQSARVIIVCAGMEGALASVVAGLVAAPVIALPTSTGYGASFGGISALLGMLNSCSPGISVVNIDNGFGAGCQAHRINSLGAAA